jgi:hypothetical protein
MGQATYLGLVMVSQARAEGFSVRGLVVINPGNPTGQVGCILHCVSHFVNCIVLSCNASRIVGTRLCWERSVRELCFWGGDRILGDGGLQRFAGASLGSRPNRCGWDVYGVTGVVRFCRLMLVC